MLDKWANDHGVTIDALRPGKPTDNPFIESIDGSFRDECLNAHGFLSLEDARRTIEQKLGSARTIQSAKTLLIPLARKPTSGRQAAIKPGR